MPVTPERLETRQEVRGAVASHFWEAAVQSSHSLDGLAYTLPGEPAPVLPPPSGLSRQQLLLALQALSLPLIPAFDGAAGGLVLDRVLAKAGGPNWWTSISGRAKAQKMLATHKGGQHVGDTLKDLSNYCLCSRTRLSPGRGLTLNALVESNNLEAVAEAIRQHRKDPSNNANFQRLLASLPLRSRWWLQQQLPGHQLNATVSHRGSYLDSAASECYVPLAMSLDLASNDRPDGIQYRAGLHQVSAPEAECSSGSQNVLMSPRDSSAQAEPPLRSSLHFQGAVAVEGEAVLWKMQGSRDEDSPAVQNPLTAHLPPGGQTALHKGPSASSPSDDSAKSGAAEAKLDVAHGGEGKGGGAAASNEQQSASRPTSAAALTDPTPHNHRSLQPSPAQQETVIPYDWLVTIDAHGNALVGPGPNSSSSQQEASGLHQSAELDPLYEAPGPVASVSRGVSHPDLPGQGMKDLGMSLAEQKGRADGRNILAGLKNASTSVRELRGSISAMTRQLQAGFIWPGGRQASQRPRQHSRRAPYSAWVAQPSIKVNAAVGCLARIPLPSPTNPTPTTRRSYSNPSLPAASREPSYANLEAESSGESKGGWAQRFGNDVWGPYIRDTALRVFASGALSAQVGSFRRPVFDFTSASLRLDLGLASLHETGQVAGGLGEASRKGYRSSFTRESRDSASSSSGRLLSRHSLKHRALALEARGVWHALTATLTQQLLGPVRINSAVRLALEHPSPPTRDARGRITTSALAASARSLRPSLLEVRWGVDCVVLKTGGAVRACAWWSPLRRQGTIEARLF
ncbi:hypothetical protein WJX73_003474 [Symbiochloris irregularis]|uniref:Uncharacterized protein n=1 Tax=Symbiochloris irregularis TaxID=706552 RepID=A0AAW1PJK8_9CHLO